MARRPWEGRSAPSSSAKCFEDGSGKGSTSARIRLDSGPVVASLGWRSAIRRRLRSIRAGIDSSESVGWS